MSSQKIADLLKEIILYIACISPIDLRGNTIKNGHERSLIYNECKKNGFKIDEAIKSVVEQMVSTEYYISREECCIHDDDDLDRLFDYITCYLGIYNFNILPESQIEYYYSKFKEIYAEEDDDNSEYIYESDEDDSEDESEDDSATTQPFLVSPLLRRRMNISDDECKNTKGKEEDDNSDDDDDSDYVYESEEDDDESKEEDNKSEKDDDDDDSDYVYESEDDDKSQEEENKSEEKDDDDDSDYVYKSEEDESEEYDDESEESDDESEESDDEDENKIKLPRNFNIDTIKQYLSNDWIDRYGNQCYCINWKGNEGYMIMLPNNFIEISFEHDDDNCVANAFVRKYISP